MACVDGWIIVMCVTLVASPTSRPWQVCGCYCDRGTHPQPHLRLDIWVLSCVSPPQPPGERPGPTKGRHAYEPKDPQFTPSLDLYAASVLVLMAVVLSIAMVILFLH